MKFKLFIIFIIAFVILSAQGDFFSMYLDSLETAFAKDDFNSTSKFYNILINFDPDRFEPYYYYGYSLYKNKFIKEAVQNIGKSVEINPTEDNYILYTKVLYDYDIKLFRQSLNTALSAYPTSIELNSAKMDYFNRFNEPESAYSYASYVIKSNPNDAGALYALAKFEASRENYTPSVAYLVKLLSLKNVKNEDYLLAGRIYSDAKNYIASNKAFYKIAASPYRYYALHHITDNYFAMEIFDSASFILDSLIKYYPDSISAYSKILAIASKKKDASILDSLYAKIKINNISDSTLLDNFAYQLFKYDKYTEASAVYKTLYDSFENFANKESVQTFFFTKNYAMSKSLINRFNMKNRSDSLFVYKYNAMIFYKENKPDSSEYYFERAFYMNDSDTIMIKNLSNVYYINQKIVKLSELIENLKDKYPSLYEALNSKYFPKQE
jgi:hypothetical protein